MSAAERICAIGFARSLPVRSNAVPPAGSNIILLGPRDAVPAATGSRHTTQERVRMSGRVTQERISGHTSTQERMRMRMRLGTSTISEIDGGGPPTRSLRNERMHF